MTLNLGEKEYQFDPKSPIDISFTLKTGKENVNCFYAEEVLIETIKVGDFVGSVLEGGACDYKRLHLTPHGNGTHTECYGHISKDNYTIQEALKEYLFISELVSIEAKKMENGDLIITEEQIKNVFPKDYTPEALLIRTLPNNLNEKSIKQYSGTNPTYLAPEVCHFLANKGVKHLLLDLPSVDREEDEGKLLAHHAFWQYPHNTRKDATITELIAVPNEVKDGKYLLNIQLMNIALDASPSKPVLYAINEV